MKVSLDTTDRSFNRKLITVLLTAAALWAVWYLHEVILLVFLAIVIAIGISIPARRLQRRDLSRPVATGISVVVVTLIFLALILWLVPLLGRELETFISQLPNLLANLQGQLAGTGLGDILQSVIDNNQPLENVDLGDEGLISRFIDNGLPIVFSGAGILISVVTNLLLVLVVSVMLLIEPKSYVRSLLYVVPESTHETIIRICNQIYDTIKAWLKSLSFSIVFTSLAVFIGMSLIGVPNPAAIALFAALATFVPNIGAILPILPIALFTAGQSLELFVIATAVYLGIQLIESNVVTPMVVKKQLSIPIAGVLVFQIIAGVLFGLLGVLLAVPLLATIIVIVRELVAKYHYGYQPGTIHLSADPENHLHLNSKTREIE